MRILVTFAVEAEFAPWRKLRRFDSFAAGTGEYFAARIGGADVNVLLTGVGGKSAWLQTTKTVWDGDVDVCVSSGLAGALRTDYQPGDILAAKAVQALGWKRVIPSDVGLVLLAERCGARSVGSFFSTDRVIRLAPEKRELGRVADVVEMESGEVMYEAVALGAKVVAVRAISDGADEDLPLDFNKVTTVLGEVSKARVLGELVRHPGSVPALVRFGKQSQMAAAKLCAFLDRYVEGVAASLSTTIGLAAR